MPRRPQRRKAPRRRPVCSEHTGEIVTHVAMMPARRWTSAIVVRALSAGLSVADSINPADVYVIDGDTIRVAGRTVPLVGFDAPELGSRAHCGLERMLAARATSRLRQVVRTGGDLDRKLIPVHAGLAPTGPWLAPST